MERLRIPLEFNKNRKEDLELYNTLQKYSNPAAYIKDVLRGLLPIPGQTTILQTSQLNITNNIENDDEDLMDF
ncbi:hypothetical protein FDA25_14470 [Clostridium botulinum]|nr:hypothetical protein [Clostridium botulinum]NFH73754.1 hypothetical protein [Clostridium botulinum]NFJ73564.1 hypothetical protein [Clostridium botulinum]NFM09847.1 hypothetical protein [Clostridium botulinum]NFN63766.1 hypothetical protein [Clostridium botulinum]